MPMVTSLALVDLISTGTADMVMTAVRAISSSCGVGRVTSGLVQLRVAVCRLRMRTYRTAAMGSLRMV